MSEVKHILGISGGKDSAALAIYLKDTYPDLPILYYTCDTGCELDETYTLVNNLRNYLGHIALWKAAEGSPEPTPFDHFLKISGGYLPSVQARWCTQKMKLFVMEDKIGDEPTISYVGIRGDEEREGYVSNKPNIQSIFPFRRNIWSLDIIHLVLNDENIEKFNDCYEAVATSEQYNDAKKFLLAKMTRTFYYSKKLNALLDISVKTFNHAVFAFLKLYSNCPVSKLDKFPLIDNEDIIVKQDVFNILEESGVGVPGYYKEIGFDVNGKHGQYCRSRSGCYFCFFQQKIEWIWLLEQHPELYQKAMAYEKDGYTWIQGEPLSDLMQPERVKQIKLEHIKKYEELQSKNKSKKLIDMFKEDEVCANCFI